MARTLGRKTAALLKFRHAETPRSAREFKRAYPAEFEALKAQTGGRDFSDEMLATLRRTYESPVDWTVVEDEFEVDSAIRGLRLYLAHYRNAPNRAWVQERLDALLAKGRLCEEPNRVLKLCVGYDDLDVNARQARILDALSQTAAHSGHPGGEDGLYCVGWVRWCDLGDVWLVEEVQSDVGGARRGLDDPFMRAQVRAQGLEPEEILEVLDKVSPWHARFYEDALGFLMEWAAKAGVAVEMVDYDYKADEESPRSVYTDLPRSMGMRLSDGSTSSKLKRTWKIKPNRKRSSRRTSR
jgi:hypothetical protein